MAGIASGAEVNQNAFSNVTVGTTTIAADNKTDTLTIEAGSNITLTPDTRNDKITIAATDTIYNDTEIKNKISAVEDKLNGSGSVTFSDVTTTNLKTKGEVEIYGSQPHIDFHYNNSSNDYTSRIIETANGQLNLSAANGVKINGTTVDPNKLTTEDITLSVRDNRLTNISYTAKYCPLLDAVFVRIYGKINVNMNLGYDYDVLNIESRKPTYVAALATKAGKSMAACTKNSGVISLRPLTENISASSSWDIYITGFWFVSS